MQIVEVSDSKGVKEFLDFPKRLYSRKEAWVCPLDKEIESIFSPEKNKSFVNGEAIRWILKSSEGKTIGRIAAFYDMVKARAAKQLTGGIGFFEVIDNRDAAFLMFDTAIEWLRSKDMLAVDAPVNFGENENHWGLLVEGFTHQGYGMPYHKPYYRKFFEDYGFRNYYEQYSYHKDVGAVHIFPERFARIADRVEARPGYVYEHADFIKVDKYVNDLVEVYNSAWTSLKIDFVPLDPEIIKESFMEAKFLLDEDLLWFVYFEGKPIAFFMIFPDFNQIFRHFRGKLTAWNKLRIAFYHKTNTITRVRALAAGIHPQFRNIGVETVYFKKLFEVFRRKTFYKELELSWVGDYNPKMESIYKALGAEKAKTHITYRYLFDREAPFVRYKDEEAETTED